MKTRRHFALYIAHTVFYIILPLQTWSSVQVIEQSLGATLVCPFTVSGGPKAIANVTIGCFSDTACTAYNGNNASWGNRTAGFNPILTNGSHTLSNDAMASVSLPTACANAATQCIQIQVKNPNDSATALLYMQATVVSGVFTCTTTGTLDISGL